MTTLNKQVLYEELEVCSKDRMRRIALALLDKLESAEEHIAKLEARTVTLPEPFKMAKSSSDLIYYYADEVDTAIQTADIGVKGGRGSTDKKTTSRATHEAWRSLCLLWV